MVKKKATIRDVAQHAGISYQTVSRVINNSEKVSSETRARVEAAIEALNFRPNMGARRILQEKTSIIGVVSTFRADDPQQLQIICGISSEAALRGYRMLLNIPRSPDMVTATYGSLLNEQIVDGVIVEGENVEAGAELLSSKGYPVIMAGHSARAIPCVHSDDESGAYIMTQHLVAMGHKRIGVISGPHDNLASQQRWQGYNRALRDANLPIDNQLMAAGDYFPESGYRGASVLMGQPNPPTAIFAFNDLMAMSAIRWLHEHGCSVPEDVSVTGYDDIPTASLYNPTLTTVRQYSFEIGQRATALLFDVIQDQSRAYGENVMPTQLLVRRSSAARRP